MNYKNNTSLWTTIEDKIICDPLTENISVDVLIIGGGITGISTLYHLINSNLKVCLVEKNTVGSGITSKTTGKLTYLQENILSKINKYLNIKNAKLYLESQKDAINIVKNIINKEKIDCNLDEVKSFLLGINNNKELNKEIKILKELNVKFKETNKLPDNKKIEKSIYVNDAYVFHPLKYLYELKNKCLKHRLSIYENTKIISIKKEDNYYICKTPNNYIKAKKVVLALHYPYFLIPYLMPLKCYLEKSYIKVLEEDKNYQYSAITINKPTLSIRYYSDNNKHYKIVLKNSHNLAIKNNEKENFKNLINADNPEYVWSNIDIITNDSIPFIGSLDDNNSLLIGTGYNTWGMTNGSLAGKILSDIILNKNNKYIDLFNPRRKINIGKIINTPLILCSNAYSFTKSKISKNKSWYNNKIKFETRDGKELAIYIDKNNKEHIVYNKCPHLKCGLQFNDIEKTWDCPCHGSRFDIDGKSIEGPSNYNITYKD